MPAKYDSIKEAFLRRGSSEQDAKKRAAMIYNGTRAPGTPPVTRNYEKTKREKGDKR